jgi:ligand-binding sensor domain-containing protein/AraC-like DNA-binding protein
MNLRNLIKLLLMGFFLNPWLLIVYAQQPVKPLDYFHLHTWSTDNGFPVNTINTITQTPDGYLWLGTEIGLIRFDGVKYDLFNRENVPEFPENLVLSLLVEKQGRGMLWIGVINGIICYKNGQFFPLPEQAPVRNSTVRDMIESRDGSVWIGSKAGLFLYFNNTFKEISLPPEMKGKEVLSLLEDGNGRIWAGIKNGGLVLIKRRGDRFEAETAGLTGCDITAIFEDRTGNLWAATKGSGVYQIKGKQVTPFTVKSGLSDNSLHCLHEDRLGNIWIGTDGGGMNLLLAGQKQIVTFQCKAGLPCNNILSFFEDRERTLWVGTGGGGLNSLREAQITTYTTSNGLSYNIIYGVFQDSSGRIWMGTKGYGANYFKNNRFYLLSSKDGLSSDTAMSFTEDKSGSIWIGTLGGGLNRFKNGKVDVFKVPGGPSANSFRALYTDPEGNVWAGSSIGEVHRFQNHRFNKICDLKFRINSFLMDSRGTLWAATFGGGLCKIQLSPEGVNTSYINTADGLGSNIVSSLLLDEEGVLWICSSMGLNRLKNGELSVVNKRHGLPDDVVYCILQDHKKDFWISSNYGIYYLSRKELKEFFDGTSLLVHPVLYGKEAGLKSLECNGANQPAGWKDVDGKLWFPTTHGISVVDPRDIGGNKIPPPVVMEKIVAGDISYSANSPVTLPPGVNDIELHYTALSFIVPRKIRFKYRMDGVDEEWNGPEKARKILYTNLPPGKYRFRVTACNSDGIWNNNGVSVVIHVEPKFYQTILFKIILSIFGLFTAASIGYLFKKKIKWMPGKKLKLKQKQKDRITLENDETQEYIRKLTYLFEVEHIYKDSNLSVKMLSSRLVITPRHLSQIINENLKTNFYDLVTEYRIKEAQRILMNSNSRNTSVLDIAHDVGYNSKSAFNRAFKNVTQMTPSQYRKKYRDSE